MEWTLGVAAIIMLVVGLVGQAFEMRRIRLAASGPGGTGEDGPAPANVFTDRRNIKWYAILGAGIVVWYAAERM